MTMTSSNVTKPTIAFFGATGGCASTALQLSLQAGYDVTALARTPSKLTTLLLSNGVSQALLDSHLSIIEGDVKDESAVREALTVKDKMADIIVSGVGGLPKFTPNPLRPGLTDPTICADAIRTILSALSSLLTDHPAAQKPLMLVISSTGLSRKARDIPLATIPLYHWMLPVAHADKRAMEDVLVAAGKDKQGPIRGFVVVRPSLLTNGPSLGPEKTRVGWEIEDGEDIGPAVGYTISRKGVGTWIFEQVVQNERRDEWTGRAVTLTY